ncbi:valacyclovir hydrolase-like [Rhopalosiphum maidis]|uniref:valacyclovir hydrolase-like n=1 Tax=Rhopalosiphum maidis TaxID=43146 RepID=UPI000EFF03F4|nr:valacyclovir hydrolase-like [Rhopalosiphum maidis]XP_026806437.1 valacyclovir hydrolase-like [Rhopalosiphum maidis]
MDLSSMDGNQNSTKIKIKGVDINYVKIGNGPQKLLIFQGVLGQISDFLLLTQHFDKNKYTIYLWDPPGDGLSRPPVRDFSPGFLNRDADYAIALMEALGVDKYSMLGWCNGGSTAIIAASKVADRVDKLVVSSCSAYVTGNVLEVLESSRDVRRWPDSRRIPRFKMYGEKYISEKWSELLNAFQAILHDDGGNVCIGALAQIKAPTLILHGTWDEILPIDHADFLHKNIKNSILEIFPNGEHDIHISFPVKFSSLVDNFLTII